LLLEEVEADPKAGGSTRADSSSEVEELGVSEVSEFEASYDARDSEDAGVSAGDTEVEVDEEAGVMFSSDDKEDPK